MKSFQPFCLFIGLLMLQSCNRHAMQFKRYENKRKELAYTDSSIISKRNTGIDFIAQGDIPQPWKLEMDFDHNYTLTTTEKKISCAPANSIKTLDPMGETFNAKGVNEMMEVNILAAKCDKEHQSKITSVKIKDTLYKGCGEFLYNQQLHNKWTLAEIDNEEIDDYEFPLGKPYLNLDLSKLSMYGFDGCNGISSSISIYGDRIKFSGIASTLKACINVKTEKMKLELLSDHLVEYRFRNNELVLYLIDDSRLIFKPQF